MFNLNNQKEELILQIIKTSKNIKYIYDNMNAQNKDSLEKELRAEITKENLLLDKLNIKVSNSEEIYKDYTNILNNTLLSDFKFELKDPYLKEMFKEYIQITDHERLYTNDLVLQRFDSYLIKKFKNDHSKVNEIKENKKIPSLVNLAKNMALINEADIKVSTRAKLIELTTNAYNEIVKTIINPKVDNSEKIIETTKDLCESINKYKLYEKVDKKKIERTKKHIYKELVDITNKKIAKVNKSTVKHAAVVDYQTNTVKFLKELEENTNSLAIANKAIEEKNKILFSDKIIEEKYLNDDFTLDKYDECIVNGFKQDYVDEIFDDFTSSAINEQGRHCYLYSDSTLNDKKEIARVAVNFQLLKANLYLLDRESLMQNMKNYQAINTGGKKSVQMIIATMQELIDIKQQEQQFVKTKKLSS